VQHGDYVGHELNGQLGAGGPRIKLGNVNGRITIKHAQDGRPVSAATSLLTTKDKDKDKYKDKGEDDDGEGDKEAQRHMSAVDRREAMEARRAERAQRVEAARSNREMQVEVQREVERAIRDAQREIELAQREIERETQREVRERMRREVRGGAEGIGEGKGSGRGSGYKGLTEQESKTFSVAGSPRVNIVTFDGAITVHGWDNPQVKYTATKRGGDEQELKQVTIQSEQQGSSVSIVARSEESNGAASLDVYVPRNSTLHVTSQDGELNLDGVSGELTLRTGDGSIKVTNGGGQLQVNTGDGEIRIASFEGQVDARTGDGEISLDGKFTGLAARTGDGNISLSVPGNSDFTIETNAEGIDNAGMTISEDIAPSKRVKRWRVGRGGNVFVLNTGDGRIALNSR
jgi:Putative adhesin